MTNTSAIKRGTAAYVTNRRIDRNDSRPPRSKHFQPRDQFHQPIVNSCLPSVLTVPPTKVKRVLLDGGRHSELQLARLQGTRREKGGNARSSARIEFHFGKNRAIFLPRTSSVQPPLEEKNLNYVIPRVNQTGSKGRRGNLVAI